MNEITQQTAQAAETTQAMSGIECPVCQTANTPLSIWCAECGFRLDSTPGEASPGEPRYSVTDGQQTIFLKPGENVVGRLNADVFLSDASVSRRHAVITVGDDAVTVRDENSANGTRLDGQALTAGEVVEWKPGRTVEFGSARLKLVSPEGEGAEEEIEMAQPVDAVAWLRGAGMEFALKEGASSIGRRPGNDVVVPDPYVSGNHATITIEGDTVSIADTGSANGTFINDSRLEAGQAVALTAGQTIRFARVDLRFEWAVRDEDESDS